METQQSKIYDECVIDLVDGKLRFMFVSFGQSSHVIPSFSSAAFFEGFNATILAYGQTGTFSKSMRSCSFESYRIFGSFFSVLRKWKNVDDGFFL